MAIELETQPDQIGSGAESPTIARKLTRRHVLMGAALLAASGIALARAPKRRYPDLSEKQFEALFPGSFGDWKTEPVSELVLPPESELADALYQHILTRTYVNSEGMAVMFLAAYNSMQLNNVQVHRPEICYYASGFTIDESEPLIIPVGKNIELPARTVTATQGSRVEQILYWTRIGNDFPQSWSAQRIAMTKANLEGSLPDGLLLRISVITKDRTKAVQGMETFIGDMLANTGPRTRQLMIANA